MKLAEFKETAARQLENSMDCLLEKMREYTIVPGSDPNYEEFDVFVAFKRAAALTGQRKEQALAGMMAKHTISVYDMLKDGISAYPPEQWEEKITDHINYLVILKAMVEESR